MTQGDQLVHSLIDAIIARLPHATGIDARALGEDKVVGSTRTTLVGISGYAMDTVLRRLVSSIEKLSKRDQFPQSLAEHVEQSALLVLELLADCCRAHWKIVRDAQMSTDEHLAGNSPSPQHQSNHQPSPDFSRMGNFPGSFKKREHSRWIHRYDTFGADHNVVPPRVADVQVFAALDVLTGLMAPIPENYQLPHWSLLEMGPWALPCLTGSQVDILDLYDESNSKEKRVQRAASDILEYLSASNWPTVFKHLQRKLRSLRDQTNGGGSANTAESPQLSKDEAYALSSVQVLAHLWVNGRKLGAIIKELCGYFLSLSKTTQNVIAILLPQTIVRWLDRNPAEFVHLHTTEARLEGGADILFDMSNSMYDDVQRRIYLAPLQTSLLLLLPDVFRTAGTLTSAKGGSSSKKAAYLEGLRKSLHVSRTSDAASFCLLGLCQIARHFPIGGDSALLNYALDVQNEIREEIFDQAVSTETPPDRVPDLYLTIAAIISLSYLEPESVLENVLPKCLQQNAPVTLKVGLFASCNLIARQLDSSRYIPLFVAVAPHIRAYLKASRSGRNTPQDELPTGGQHSEGTADLISQRGALSFMLGFLAQRPETLFEEIIMTVADSYEALHEELENIVPFLADEDELIRDLASSIIQSATTKDFVSALSQDLEGSSSDFGTYFCSSTSLILSSLSNQVIERNLNESAIKTFLTVIDHVLRARLDASRHSGDPSKGLGVGVDMQLRSTASANLEVAFLLLLCSSNLDICVAVTKCFAIYCEEGSLTESCTELAPSSLSIMRNFEVYTELCSPNYRLTGMVAFQKRVRKSLAKMVKPSIGILSAWESAFARWSDLNGRIMMADVERDHISSEKTFTEWRNFSGFLASIGGCCVSDSSHSAQIDESMMVGLRWIDRLSPEKNGRSLLDSFLSQCLELLLCSNVLARENIRDVLGLELNIKLFPYLLQSIQSVLDGFFQNPSTGVLPQSGAVVFEQAALLLKAMVERSHEAHEPYSTTDFETICLHLSLYANSLPQDIATLRAKIRVCHLCLSVTRRRDSMNLGQAIRVRNQLLGITFGWISRLGPSHLESVTSSSGQRVDEVIRHRRDLNRICLQTIVNLTYRLPLQPVTDQSDVDSFEPKTQLFFDYFRRLLSLLEDESAQPERMNDPPYGSYRSEELSSALDLTISALSNLLSANVDVGLKHALQMGYHENTQVRTAFLRVLCNILSQEADFERLSDAAVVEKYKILLQAITRDISLVVVLCDSCSSSYIDELAIALLNIFESRGTGFQLLKALIRHEVATTDNETELLRRHSVTTKMLSAYARWNGGHYLRSTIQQTVERLIKSSDKLNLELDPSRSASPEELHQNALQLQTVTEMFIDEICNSADRIPATFGRICHTIAVAVTPRFPEAKFTAVGAFIFLRYFCPAIVAPDAEGLINSAPSKEMRRGLLLIAKVVQNLANNVLFGTKEQYMSPLNDFLAQNIYRVTTFLRDISARLPIIEDTPLRESFDFGSSVVLHRFLFDHWDIVRQKLSALERSSWRSSVAGHESEGSQTQRSSSLSQLSELVPSLGTPHIDTSWKIPQPSANNPRAYSRFQEFMFRNVRKYGENITSMRAVYDGGQSRDELPTICIVLRTIEQEEIDLDLLLFTFFKIASRMWHRQFSVLIDVTCYRGLIKTPDQLVKKVSSLRPSEISKNLARIYIYNTNTVYRKCFRHLWRVIERDTTNLFHSDNLEYHLIGSPQELQTHFNLASLQLPKETISIVTDTRFVIHPVTRLTRNRGKVGVIIKIGGQYVQVTTEKPQGTGPGSRLSGIINDIFRLTDIEEAKAPVSLEDETAFGFKIEDGKFFIYFLSPRKAEILNAIRVAKAKYRKGFKSTKLIDRLVKPDDVPGSLLNISLMNLASGDRALRLASYNAISGLSKAFHFDTDERLITAKELDIPANSTVVVKGVSEKLASSEPRLTHDFLSEFFIGWARLTSKERPLSIIYMSPWLRNISRHVMFSDAEAEKGKEKAAAIVRKLIETMLRAPDCSVCCQTHVWPVIAQDDSLIDVFLDEMVKLALENGPEADHIEAIASIAAAIGTISLKGKIISRLRKLLNRSPVRPTRDIADNSVWDETRVLLRMCLEASFESRGLSQLFLPELFHIATMTLHGGSAVTSAYVHGLLINTIHSLCTTFPLSDARLTKLKTVLISLTEPNVELLFDLHRGTTAKDLPPSDKVAPDAAMFSHLQNITNLLQSVIELGAPSEVLANTWRARWTSLVASTAFQSNPAIQSKAFTVMGCLATEDVDDDLLYQVLVSLRKGISRFLEGGDSELLISIITTLTKMVGNLATNSRYVKQLFWLAISLVRLVPLSLFNCAASLLEAVAQVLAVRGAFAHNQMAEVLLQGRSGSGPVLQDIDESYGVRFAHHSFHIAVTVCLLRGLPEPTTRATTVRVFSTFLDITSRSLYTKDISSTDSAVLPYILLLGTRATTVEERRAILWLARRMSQVGLPCPSDVWEMVKIDYIADTELLCNILPIIVNFEQYDDLVQQHSLQFLLQLALQRPSIIALLMDPLTALLGSILTSSQSSGTLESAHALMSVVARESQKHANLDTACNVKAVLSNAGLEGMWKTSTFKITQDRQRSCGILVDKFIERLLVL